MRFLTAALVLIVAASTARAGDLIPTNPGFGPLRVASHKVDQASTDMLRRRKGAVY